MLLWTEGDELDTASELRTFSCGVADSWVELLRLQYVSLVVDLHATRCGGEARTFLSDNVLYLDNSWLDGLFSSN